jgi:hypothetical protein
VARWLLAITVVAGAITFAPLRSTSGQGSAWRPVGIGWEWFRWGFIAV